MTHLQILTLGILGATACLLALYDVFAYVRGGVDATISRVLLKKGKERPIIPFALGVVLGHIFWVNN